MLIDSWEKLIEARKLNKPQVARLHLDANSQYFTPYKDSQNAYKVILERFIIVGTVYGCLRTTGGDIRTWTSYSGAYKFLKSKFHHETQRQ